MFNYSKKFTKVLLLSTTLTSALVATSSTYAERDKFAIGGNIGLSGFGLEGRTPIANKLYGRLGVNYFSYTYNTSGNDDNGNSELKYGLKLNLLTVPLMIDFHPFENFGFRLSAGVAYNGNEIKGSFTPTQNIILYGSTYTPQEAGSLTTTFKYKNKLAPIVSFGYDSSLMNNNLISFNFEAGIMYSGKAQIKATATGLASTQTQFLSDINRDANASLNSVQKYLKFFPVVNLGIKFSF